MKTSCTILIYNYESLCYLKACVRKIRQYKHPDIEQHILICDQSQNQGSIDAVKNEFGDSSDVTIVNLLNLFSGYSVDYALRYCNIKTEYLACMDVDAFPISNSYLYVPIMLMKEYGFRLAGGLAFEGAGTESIYPPQKFYSMSPFFCVGKKEDWRELSMAGGFTRYHERPKVNVPMEWSDKYWDNWAKENDEKDYWSRGSDDHVPAFLWGDKNREWDKISFAITDIMGEPGVESGYGRILDGLVFHFGFCFQALGLDTEMGKKYVNWRQRIHDDFSDELIEEMLAFARGANNETADRFRSRGMWDGKEKKSMPLPEYLHKRIEELKKA